MSVSIFRYGRRLSTSIKLPINYRDNATWQPQLNERFPDFTAVTTFGALTLHDWARGDWVYLMSHPAAFTPVCSTELGELARRATEFAKRNVRILALTRDNVDQISAWTQEIEAIYDTSVGFPHIADPEGVISRACGLITREAEGQGRMCVRRTYLIDPKGIIRAIFDYPLSVGRSVDEALRTIDALQVADMSGNYTPGEWKSGDPVLVGGGLPKENLIKRYGNQIRSLAPYLNFFDICKPSEGAGRNTALPAVQPAIAAAKQTRRILMTRLMEFPADARGMVPNRRKKAQSGYTSPAVSNESIN